MAAPATAAAALPSLEYPAIAELASIAQWVCCRLPEKNPLQANGYDAKSDTPATWTTFQAACSAVVAGRVHGVGFVVTRDDDLVGVDLDKCLDDHGAIRDSEIAEIVRDLDSYTEISPSGRGLHVWVKGSLSQGCKVPGKEIYPCGQYLTVTGRHFPGTPETIEWRQEALERVVARVRTSRPPPSAAAPVDGKVAEGGRNNAVFTEGRRVHLTGLRGAVLSGAIHGWNAAHCDPPLDDDEVDKIVASVERNVAPFDPGPEPPWIGDESPAFVMAPSSGPPAAEATDEDRPGPIALPVLRWAEIEMPKRTDYLIKGLIPSGGFGMVFGAWGSSKSFAMLDAAAHVAAGEQWMGLRVHQAPVVYVCAEGAGGFVKRAAALKAEKFPAIPLLVVPAPVNLLDAAAVDRLADAIHAHEPGARLVVFDTWAHSIPGGNEEKQSEIQPALDACARLRQEFDGLTALILHHPGRNQQERSRGAYGLEAACDFIARVSKDGDVCRIETTKAKDGPLPAPLAYRLRVVDLGIDQDGDAITTCVVDPCDDPARPSSRVAQATRSKHGQILVRIMEEQSHRIGTLAPDELRLGLAETGMPGPQVGQLVFPLGQLSDSYVDRAGQTADTKPDTLRRGFQRALVSLQAAGIVKVFREWVWFK